MAYAFDNELNAGMATHMDVGKEAFTKTGLVVRQVDYNQNVEGNGADTIGYQNLQNSMHENLSTFTGGGPSVQKTTVIRKTYTYEDNDIDPGYQEMSEPAQATRSDHFSQNDQEPDSQHYEPLSLANGTDLQLYNTMTDGQQEVVQRRRVSRVTRTVGGQKVTVKRTVEYQRTGGGDLTSSVEPDATSDGEGRSEPALTHNEQPTIEQPRADNAPKPSLIPEQEIQNPTEDANQEQQIEQEEAVFIETVPNPDSKSGDSATSQTSPASPTSPGSSRTNSLNRRLSSREHPEYYNVSWRKIRGIEKEKDEEFW